MDPAKIVPRRSVVLVIVTWGDQPLWVRTVEPGQSLWLGNRTGDIPIPPFAQLHGERVRLVAFDRRRPVFAILAEAEPSREVGPSGSETLTLKIGDFSLTLTVVEAGRAERRRFRAALEPARWAAAVGLVLFSTLAVMAQSLPSLGLTVASDIERALSIGLSPRIAGRAEPDPPPPPLYLSRAPTQYLIPINGAMRCGSDVMGNPEAIAENGRYAVEGSKDNADPHLATHRGSASPVLAIAPRSAKGVGGDPKAPTMPWAYETAWALDELSARGKMWGDPIEDASGNDGFGLPRVEGGIAKALHWTSAASSETPPRVLHAGLRIQGTLRPSLVTAALARRFDRFHACYDRAREKAPALGGKLELHFDVGSDGKASAAGARASTLGDPEFSSCLVASLGDLTFAATEAGGSKVTYPLFFEPGSGKRVPNRLARREPPKDLPRTCCSR